MNRNSLDGVRQLPSDIVLSLDSITHRYESVVAVDAFSLDVHRGETFGLIGPDGAGKTTVLRIVLGLLRPSEGTATTLGLDPAQHRRRLSQRVGYLSQRFSIYGDLSIDENVAFFARAHDMRKWKPRREELLERLDLARFRSRLADRLSGGMKQKLALACTLIHTPEFLVLDEPTTGVDPVSRREFWRILSELQHEGMTLIVTTPYLDEAERCGRVGLIDQGHLLVVDEPALLRGSAAGSMIELLADPRRAAQSALREFPEVGELEIFGERIHVSLPGVDASDASEVAARIAGALGRQGIEVRSARVIKPSLEDIFIQRLRSRTDFVPLLLAMLLMLGIHDASAQTGADWEGRAPIVLSLESALERAQSVSPRIATLDAMLESTRGAKREADAARFPELALSAGYTRLSEERTLELTIPGRGTLELFPDLPNRWRSRLGLSFPLWTGGRIGGGIAAARSAEEAAAHERAGGEQDLSIEVTEAYWTWVVSLEQSEVLDSSLLAYDQHHHDIEHLLDVGMAAVNDLLAIQVERDRTDLTRLRARKAADIAQENLRRLLQTEAPLEPAEATLELPSLPSLEQLQDTALTARPERGALEARLGAARARERVARAGWFPQLFVIGGYDYANPNSRIVPPEDRWDDSWDLGVQLSWSLFDGGKVSGALQRARGEARAVEAQLESLDQAIRLEVFARYRDLETAREAAALSDMTVSAAEENLTVTRNRFKEGVLGSADLLDAETSALRAALDRKSAYAELRIVSAALDRAAGVVSRTAADDGESRER